MSCRKADSSLSAQVWTAATCAPLAWVSAGAPVAAFPASGGLPPVVSPAGALAPPALAFASAGCPVCPSVVAALSVLVVVPAALASGAAGGGATCAGTSGAPAACATGWVAFGSATSPNQTDAQPSSTQTPTACNGWLCQTPWLTLTSLVGGSDCHACSAAFAVAVPPFSPNRISTPSPG